MFPDREPDDAPRPHVQHRVQEELALVGADLGAVAVPLTVQPVGGEVTRNPTGMLSAAVDGSGPVPATSPGPGGWSACGDVSVEPADRARP